jgi:hypothetical protein
LNQCCLGKKKCALKIGADGAGRIDQEETGDSALVRVKREIQLGKGKGGLGGPDNFYLDFGVEVEGGAGMGEDSDFYYNKVRLDEGERDGIECEYIDKLRSIRDLSRGKNVDIVDYGKIFVEELQLGGRGRELEPKGDPQKSKEVGDGPVSRDFGVAGSGKGEDSPRLELYKEIVSKLIPNSIKNNFQII